MAVAILSGGGEGGVGRRGRRGLLLKTAGYAPARSSVARERSHIEEREGERKKNRALWPQVGV